MRILIAILFLLKVLVLQASDPEFNLNSERSVVLFSKSKPGISVIADYPEKHYSLASLFSEVNQRLYQKERFYIRSRFSGRTKPILRATTIKLSYKYVIVALPFNTTPKANRNSLANTFPFVSVILNRTSIYSDLYRFHNYSDHRQPQSLHDLGVSIGAGLRLPITSRFHLDVGVRDELGLLNLDGYILGNYKFSQNNSAGFMLGLRYII